MNIKQIRELAQIVKECGLTALEVTEGETHIRLKSGTGAPLGTAPAQAPAPAPAAAEGTGSKPDSPIDFNKVYEVKASLVGVFYAAPAPDAPPFVSVGSKVKKGDVLCIIEAMKLMNEIVADRDGEVADVCVRTGEVVEYGQTLFKLC